MGQRVSTFGILWLSNKDEFPADRVDAAAGSTSTRGAVRIESSWTPSGETLLCSMPKTGLVQKLTHLTMENSFQRVHLGGEGGIPLGWGWFHIVPLSYSKENTLSFPYGSPAFASIILLFLLMK